MPLPPCAGMIDFIDGWSLQLVQEEGEGNPYAATILAHQFGAESFKVLSFTKGGRIRRWILDDHPDLPFDTAGGKISADGLTSRPEGDDDRELPDPVPLDSSKLQLKRNNGDELPVHLVLHEGCAPVRIRGRYWMVISIFPAGGRVRAIRRYLGINRSAMLETDWSGMVLIDDEEVA